MATALTVVDNHANVEAYRASTNAAELCKEIVVATSSNIQGRRFVSVEGWQALAVAHGCVLSARDVEKVEGGVRAIGEVRRMADGQVIATGEGFVGEDEATWFGGDNGKGRTLPKRADYAIRAMAQTRAMSRAGRTAFAHVVVMMKAGLATTPAEEVPQDGFDRETGEILETETPPREPIKGITAIKTRLRRMQEAGDAPDITLDQFKKLKRDNRDDLKAIRDGNHLWWTGDGGDVEGFGPWIARREAELSGEDGSFKVLIDSLKQTETRVQLDEWIERNMDMIEALDDADRRKFEQAKDWHESAILEMDKASS